MFWSTIDAAKAASVAESFYLGSFAHFVFHLLLPFLQFSVLRGLKTNRVPAAVAITRFHRKVHIGSFSSSRVFLVHVEVVLSVDDLFRSTHEACALVLDIVNLFAVLICLIASSLLPSMVVHDARVFISDALGLLSVLMMPFRAQIGASAACAVREPALGFILNWAQVQGQLVRPLVFLRVFV